MHDALVEVVCLIGLDRTLHAQDLALDRRQRTGGHARLAKVIDRQCHGIQIVVARHRDRHRTLEPVLHDAHAAERAAVDEVEVVGDIRRR